MFNIFTYKREWKTDQFHFVIHLWPHNNYCLLLIYNFKKKLSFSQKNVYFYSHFHYKYTQGTIFESLTWLNSLNIQYTTRCSLILCILYNITTVNSVMNSFMNPEHRIHHIEISVACFAYEDARRFMEKKTRVRRQIYIVNS